MHLKEESDSCLGYLHLIICICLIIVLFAPWISILGCLFPKSTTSATTIFNLLHLDVWGPYHVPTFDGNKIFLTVVDDHSRITWLFLLKLKSDNVVVLRQFFTTVRIQLNTKVKLIR